MNRKLIGAGVMMMVVVMGLTGCGKKAEAPTAMVPAKPLPASVEVVQERERSKHFIAVSRELELGGTLYGYVDVDGDVAKIATGMRSFVEQIAKSQPMAAPFAQQDFPALFSTLGLNDIVAAGVSSVPDGTGFFRNRVFLYTPNDRHGLLASLGGKPGPFTHVNLAPADADVYVEAEIDLPVAYRAIKDAVAKVGGDTAGNMMEDTLKKAGDAAAFSVMNLIYGLKGHSAMVARLAPDKPMRLPVPGGFTVPTISLLICVDGVGSVIEPTLTRTAAFTMTQTGSLHLYELNQPIPLNGIKPVIAVDGSTFYVATTIEFLNECRATTKGLAQTSEFQTALAKVGEQGNGLAYVSPRLFDHLQQLETMNPTVSPETKSTIHLVLSNLPKIDRPLISVRINRPDGILVKSYWDRSLKQDLAMISLYNPVTIGVMASMAIPAFQKVRSASQEKAVMNNLIQLSAAAEQFRRNNGGKNPVYADLVGPGKMIRAVIPVAGENYRTLRFIPGPLSVRLPTGATVEYKPQPAGMDLPGMR